MMARPVCWCMLLLLLTAAAGAGEKAESKPKAPSQKVKQSHAKWGNITYPLFGNIRTEEGSLLCHFRVEEDVTEKEKTWFHPKPEKYWYRFFIATIRTNPNNRVRVFYRLNNAYIHFGLQAKVHQVKDRYGKRSRWKPGEDHVVGFTWNRKGEHTLWINGEAIESTTAENVSLGIGEVDRKTSLLTLGGQKASAITFLGVHITDKALDGPTMALPKKELFVRRASTLLLDRFEESFKPDGKQQTKAVYISGFSGERGGTPSRVTGFVEVSQGRGLRLYTPPVGVEPPATPPPAAQTTGDKKEKVSALSGKSTQKGTE